MTLLHMFYQTRWAVRNDPALGFAMCVLFGTIFSYLDAWKQARNELAGRIFVSLIEVQEMEGRHE